MKKELNDKLHKASVIFAKEAGIAVLEGSESESIIRWIGAGALSKEQLNKFSKIYENIN